MVTNATFALEQEYWQQGITLVAGVDEVGMGALAGPVVAAAVIFPLGCEIEGLRDSKKLSTGQREKLVNTIVGQCVSWGVGEASVKEIARYNIRGASHVAMRRAIKQLTSLPELLLVDGRSGQIHRDIPTVNIIKGDAISASIAAASIVAKVHRDSLMTALHEDFPAYEWVENKGYGSARHMARLRQMGPTIHHRAEYAPVAEALKLAVEN